MTDSTGTSSWTYNSVGKLTSLTTPQGSMTYAYNTAGQRTSMVESGVGTTTYAYDSARRLQSITNAFNETTSFVYDSNGRVGRKNIGNGTYEEYSYDGLSRVTAISVKNSLNVEIDRKEYIYDSGGRVSQAVEGGVTTTYGYDAIDQLISESKPSLNYSASYTYDANGNRSTKTVNGTVEYYTFDNADKLLTAGNKSYGYDAAGRTTSITSGGITTSLSYDYEDRVTAITRNGMTTNTFNYNGLDARVRKVDSGGTRNYSRDGIGVQAPVLSDGAANYTPELSERRGGVSTYLHEGLKNATAQSSTTQTITATRQYDAYGNMLSSSGDWSGPYGYAGGFGYETDTESALKLLGHRYYDSTTGRFLTRDPAKDRGNYYRYCDNSPVDTADPSGLKTIVIIIGEGNEDEGWIPERFKKLAKNWESYLTKLGHTVIILESPNKKKLEAALGQADVIIYIGHGTSAGWHVRQTTSFKYVLNPEMLAGMLKGRRISLIISFACLMMKDPAVAKNWRKICLLIFGFDNVAPHASDMLDGWKEWIKGGSPTGIPTLGGGPGGSPLPNSVFELQTASVGVPQ